MNKLVPGALIEIKSTVFVWRDRRVAPPGGRILEGTKCVVVCMFRAQVKYVAYDIAVLPEGAPPIVRWILCAPEEVLTALGIAA